MQESRDSVILHVDGGARGNPGPAAAGVVLRDSNGSSILEAGYLLGRLTNNQAEYSALLMGLQAAGRCGARSLTIYVDSELVARQVIGEYRVKSAELRALYEDVRQQLVKLDSWKIHHVPREDNRRADQLVNLALDADDDVIEVQLDEVLQRLTHRPPTAARAVAKQSDGAALPILLEVTKPAGKGACSEACRRHGRYVVDNSLPAGLSLDVAAGLINAVSDLRTPGRASPEPLTMTCAACGAVFEVSVYNSS